MEVDATGENTEKIIHIHPTQKRRMVAGELCAVCGGVAVEAGRQRHKQRHKQTTLLSLYAYFCIRSQH